MRDRMHCISFFRHGRHSALDRKGPINRVFYATAVKSFVRSIGGFFAKTHFTMHVCMYWTVLLPIIIVIIVDTYAKDLFVSTLQI